MTCELCIRKAHHYPKQCSEPCSEGEHDIDASYADYGYWSGRCKKCGRFWEMDSSG